MFFGAEKFNQYIATYTGKVTDIKSECFLMLLVFNQDTDKWNTIKLKI